MKGARFPADPRSAAAARRWLREAVPPGWSDRLDDMLLLVSELVTNAVLHARSAVRVTVTVLDGTARVEITDDAQAAPAPRDAAQEDTGGRGLSILEALADRWGTVRRGAGKVVWFELDHAVAG